MLLWLAQYLEQYSSVFNVFNYQSTRALFAAATSLGISVLLGPWLIRQLQIKQIGQAVRNDGPESHLSKSGTPTMGGVLIIASIVIGILLWGDLSNKFLWVIIGILITFGAVGWVDDWRKVVEKNPRGLPGKWKYFWLSLGGLVAAIILWNLLEPEHTPLLIPFFKDVSIVMPMVIFIVFAYFVIVGTSNAVNLTDGLDGLAIMPTMMVGGALGIFGYVMGHAEFAQYLNFPFIQGTGELVVVSAALLGAGMGFLWFNTYPAQIFMGDVGALALGGLLGVMAIIVRQEIVLVIMGGVFVIETLSVILQVGSFKLRGKRVFRMAPIHHHFELKGWPEPKVIVRFWIVTFMLVLIGLATLKFR